jgi:hypothetical protein
MTRLDYFLFYIFFRKIFVVIVGCTYIFITMYLKLIKKSSIIYNCSTLLPFSQMNYAINVYYLFTFHVY